MDTIRLQASIDRDLHERFKTIASHKKIKIPDLVANLIEDFVEREEEQWLNQVFGKRLQKAYTGQSLPDLPNVKRYYEELNKIK